MVVRRRVREAEAWRSAHAPPVASRKLARAPPAPSLVSALTRCRGAQAALRPLPRTGRSVPRAHICQFLPPSRRRCAVQRCSSGTTARRRMCGPWASASTACSPACRRTSGRPRRRCLTWCSTQVGRRLLMRPCNVLVGVQHLACCSVQGNVCRGAEHRWAATCHLFWKLWAGKPHPWRPLVSRRPLLPPALPSCPARPDVDLVPSPPLDSRTRVGDPRAHYRCLHSLIVSPCPALCPPRHRPGDLPLAQRVAGGQRPCAQHAAGERAGGDAACNATGSLSGLYYDYMISFQVRGEPAEVPCLPARAARDRSLRTRPAATARRHAMRAPSRPPPPFAAQRDPSRRPTPAEILKSPWLSEAAPDLPLDAVAGRLGRLAARAKEHRTAMVGGWGMGTRLGRAAPVAAGGRQACSWAEQSLQAWLRSPTRDAVKPASCACPQPRPALFPQLLCIAHAPTCCRRCLPRQPWAKWMCLAWRHCCGAWMQTSALGPPCGWAGEPAQRCHMPSRQAATPPGGQASSR